MKECDILVRSKHILTHPTYLQGGQDLQTHDLRPWFLHTYFAKTNRPIVNAHSFRCEIDILIFGCNNAVVSYTH